MRFIHATDPDAGIADMAKRIAAALNAGRPVLWLVCGGSNIPGAVAALESIKMAVSKESLALLTVGQTDERYGPVGHPDSNWQQMRDAGFDFSAITFLPILIGKSLEETAKSYSKTIEPILDAITSKKGSIIALFGIGPDGHIAGMIPHSPAVSSHGSVCGYDAHLFIRVTLTPPILQKIDAAYVFAFGSSKREALENLQNKELSIDEEPAQILKSLPEATVYSDQI